MPVTPTVVLVAPVPGVSVMPLTGSRPVLLLVMTSVTWLGLLSASTTVNDRVGGVAPGWMEMLAMALITGVLTMLIGTTCMVLPLVPEAVHGLVIVSVSLVVVGLANSSKS